MSQARALKLREYHTDIISHDLSYKNNRELNHSHSVRMTDTFRSKALLSEIKEVTAKVGER